jgi:hypothetical protein
MTVRTKFEGKESPFHHIPITKTHEAFFRNKDLTKSIHTNQTGAFPFTSQQGNRYIVVAIHLDPNYNFVEPMQSRSTDKMIRAYKKMINRMRLAGLGLKIHWTIEPWRLSNNAPKNNKCNTSCPPPSREPPKQPSRAHNSNLQRAFHLNPSRRQ